jgi:hypothetical protein
MSFFPAQLPGNHLSAHDRGCQAISAQRSALCCNSKFMLGYLSPHLPLTF